MRVGRSESRSYGGQTLNAGDMCVDVNTITGASVLRGVAGLGPSHPDPFFQGVILWQRSNIENFGGGTSWTGRTGQFATCQKHSCGNTSSPTTSAYGTLAEALVPDGREWVRALDPRRDGGTGLTEAIEAVDLTAFLNITGQLVHTKLLQAYAQEAFVISRLIDTIPTRLDRERIAGIGPMSDQVSEVHPGMPYPHVGFGEDYIDTPSTAKHGLIIPVTKEAIFFDRTSLVLSHAAQVGETLGLNKEKRLVDLVIGVANNYCWKGRAYQTYYGADDGGPWINELGNRELLDWTAVDAAEQLFAEILDPNTGDPVLVQPDTSPGHAGVSLRREPGFSCSGDHIRRGRVT